MHISYVEKSPNQIEICGFHRTATIWRMPVLTKPELTNVTKLFIIKIGSKETNISSYYCPKIMLAI